MSPGAPQLLNVLRVCDIPDLLGILAPRKLTIHSGDAALLERMKAIYGAADAQRALSLN